MVPLCAWQRQWQILRFLVLMNLGLWNQYIFMSRRKPIMKTLPRISCSSMQTTSLLQVSHKCWLILRVQFNPTWSYCCSSEMQMHVSSRFLQRTFLEPTPDRPLSSSTMSGETWNFHTLDIESPRVYLHNALFCLAHNLRAPEAKLEQIEKAKDLISLPRVFTLVPPQDSIK